MFVRIILQAWYAALSEAWEGNKYGFTLQYQGLTLSICQYRQNIRLLVHSSHISHNRLPTGFKSRFSRYAYTYVKDLFNSFKSALKFKRCCFSASKRYIRKFFSPFCAHCVSELNTDLIQFVRFDVNNSKLTVTVLPPVFILTPLTLTV